MENTYRGPALRIAYLDGLVEVEVGSPCRPVLMENFRTVEVEPLGAYVSMDTGRGR